MQRFIFAIAGSLVMGLVGLTAQTPQPQAPAPAAAPALARSHAADSTPAPESQKALVTQYCATCHSDRAKAGGLSLVSFDPAHPEATPEVAEKMIHKLRAGMMPPAGARRPDEASLTALVTSLETRIDSLAAEDPNPGWRPFQRLNRAEYSRSVTDLLDLQVDVTAFLPADTMSDGFDNVSDAQTFSPTLMQGYLRAASRIATLALGNANATPSESTYDIPRTESQLHHVEGAPFGTRGGVSVIHNFPADGAYTFRMMLHSIPTGQLYGSTAGKDEQIEVSINGERVALLDINPRMSEADENGMNLVTKPVHVKAGPQRVSAAFIQRAEGPVNDLLAPIEYTLADSQIGSGFGVTTVPHMRDLTISGPFEVTGISDTPSREKIFSCRPTTAEEEAPCAAEIVRGLARQAYRGPLTTEDFEGLMGFYEQGRENGGDFESGIRMALQAILASPKFVFRLEQVPETATPGTNYRITELDLASRLSYFLWGTAPDAELIAVATDGKLRDTLPQQIRRMLDDPRSSALSTRFASLWLRLQDLDKIDPDALLFPWYDNRLAEAMKHETELFFDSLVREDRSLLELLTADYTFVNGRLAEHYGIPNVTGPTFQRVTLTDPVRRGILGQGSILMQTSIADRTSPVIRGKWVLEVLLGSPPPPPPPNVPPLDDVKAAQGTKMLSVRERMEQHRANPACASCHKVIDPIGLALENFDVTGKYRIKDNGVPVDSSGVLYDGTKMEGPEGLRKALLQHKDAFVLSFTKSLMTYALGRRVEFYDMPAVRKIVHAAAEQDYRMSAFIEGVIDSRAFQMSRIAQTETVADAGQQ